MQTSSDKYRPERPGLARGSMARSMSVLYSSARETTLQAAGKSRHRKTNAVEAHVNAKFTARKAGVARRGRGVRKPHRAPPVPRSAGGR